METFKFLNFDGRPNPRELPGEHFTCCKCQRKYKGKAKYYLAFIDNVIIGTEERQGFPSILNPFAIMQYSQKEKIVFLPLGSSCIKLDDLKKWAITSLSMKKFLYEFKRNKSLEVSE